MEHRGADEHASKPADVCRLYFIYYQKKKETLQKTKTIVAEWEVGLFKLQKQLKSSDS